MVSEVDRLLGYSLTNVSQSPSASPICGTAYVYGSDSYDTETYSYYVCDTTDVISSNLYGYVLFTGSVSSTVAQSLPVETSVPVSVYVTRTVTASANIAPADTETYTPSNTAPVPTTTKSSDDDASPPTGAIVGGVVGGVAALSLIAGFIAYRVIKKRKERKPSIPEISQYSDSSHAR